MCVFAGESAIHAPSRPLLRRNLPLHATKRGAGLRAASAKLKDAANGGRANERVRSFGAAGAVPGFLRISSASDRRFSTRGSIPHPGTQSSRALINNSTGSSATGKFALDKVYPGTYSRKLGRRQRAEVKGSCHMIPYHVFHISLAAHTGLPAAKGRVRIPAEVRRLHNWRQL